MQLRRTSFFPFRGILDVEFSHFVNCLTRRTHNVTIITDCCHCERIARGEQPMPGRKAWSPLNRGFIDKHIARLRHAGLYARLEAGANRYAVRVAAAASDALAYEDPGEPEMGRLTKVLVQELNRADETGTSWSMVLPALLNALDKPLHLHQFPSI